MENLLNNNGFWTITGILIGFILTFGSNLLRDIIHRHNIKKALKQELKFNCNVINEKIAVLDIIYDHLSKRNIYAVTSVPSMTNIYDEYISELSIYLDSDYKKDLHMIYWNLKINDKYIDEFEQDIKDDIRSEHKHVVDAYMQKIKGYRDNYEVILQLILKYVR